MQDWNKKFCVLNDDATLAMNPAEMQSCILAMSHVGVMDKASEQEHQPINEHFEPYVDRDDESDDSLLSFDIGEVLLLGRQPLAIENKNICIYTDFNLTAFRKPEGRLQSYAVFACSYNGDSICLQDVDTPTLHFFVASKKALHENLSSKTTLKTTLKRDKERFVAGSTDATGGTSSKQSRTVVSVLKCVHTEYTHDRFGSYIHIITTDRLRGKILPTQSDD